MKIDGKSLADGILSKLTADVTALKEKGITPKMVVILVGNDPASASYVRQKEKAAKTIGAELQIINYKLHISEETVKEKIDQLNADPSVHGVIVQLPLPPHFDLSIHRSADPKKDVDGFVPHSNFEVPIALAVEKILKHIYTIQQISTSPTDPSTTPSAYQSWLIHKRIIVIGRGKTGGKPIVEYFMKNGCIISVIHSQTAEEERQTLLTHADIIISCVGKSHIVQKEHVKKGAILISVGIWRDSRGNLHGDYEEEDAQDVASFYTPTPRGIGPVNVACLMENLVTAATMSINKSS